MFRVKQEGLYISMSTITKKDIIEKILQNAVENRKVDLTNKDVQNIIQELLSLIIKNLAKGNRIEFREFGVFSVHESPQRIAQNPATLEKVSVPRRFNVRFKQGQKMKIIVRDSTVFKKNLKK